MLTKKYINEISYRIVGSAIEVHKELGPGLLEKIYEICLIDELNNIGLNVKSQVTLPVSYKGKELELGLILDLLVNDSVIVELKSVESILPIHIAQLLTYLKLTKKPKGLLINFNRKNISQELIPLVTDEFAKLPEE